MKIFNLRKYFEEIGFSASIILFVIAIIGAIIYSNLPFIKINFVVALLAMILGVFGAYYIFMSFEKPEKPLELEKGEQRNLRTLETGVLIFPKKVGGIMSKKMHRNLSIYLTNRRIIARDTFGEHLLDLPLELIKGFNVEKVIATEYIRLRFLEKGKETDALIFVGNRNDISLWISRMKELGVKEFSKVREEEEEGEFLRDVEKIKEEI